MKEFITDLYESLYISFVRSMIWCLEFELAIGEHYGMGQHYRAQLKADIDGWYRTLHLMEINQ